MKELKDICRRLGLSDTGKSYELKDRLAGILAVHSAAARGNEGALMEKVGWGEGGGAVGIKAVRKVGFIIVFIFICLPDCITQQEQHTEKGVLHVPEGSAVVSLNRV